MCFSRLIGDDFAKLIMPPDLVQATGTQTAIDAKIALFFSSSISGSLKKINLVDLSHDDGRELLELLAKGQRFAIVVEKGDQIFAHVPRDWEGEWQKNCLPASSLKEKTLTVHMLSEKETSDLKAILVRICTLFQDKVASQKQKTLPTAGRGALKWFAFESALSSTKGGAKLSIFKNKELLRLKVTCSFQKIIIQMMERFQEERQKLHAALKRQALKKEIVEEEIQRADLRFRRNVAR